jgi:hypothetical protein
MAAKYILSRKVKTYINTATGGSAYSSPTWTAADTIRDETLNLDSEMIDVSARDTGDWGAETKGELKMTVEADIRKDPTDTVIQPKLLNSYLTNAALDMLILDGLVTVAGTKGFRADMEVGKMTNERNKKGVVALKVSLFVTANGNVPAEFTAS